MPPLRPSLIIGGTSTLILLVLAIQSPILTTPTTWYAVATAYGLTLALAAGVWYWRNHYPAFFETVGIAVVVAAVVVFALLLRSPVAFPFNLQFSVAAAFMLPLGAATTWRQRFGTVSSMLLPTLYLSADWLFLDPPSFLIVTPVTLVTMFLMAFLPAMAVGFPLFILGRGLPRENDNTAHRWVAPEAG